MAFDALYVESAFARLSHLRLGLRGTSHDADVFRGGNAKDLSVTLVDAAYALEIRVNALPFHPEDSEPGGIKARIAVAIDRLRKIAERMSMSEDEVAREHYLWEVIGCLVNAIAALLEQAEAADA